MVKKNHRRRRSAASSHHVLVFRHCVRSTESLADLCHKSNGDSNGTEQQQQQLVHFLLDFLPPPDWNAPPMWCTEEGIRQMRATGDYVLRELLLQQQQQQGSDDHAAEATTTTTTLNVRFISDTSQRDVDTALALTEGIRKAAAATAAAEQSQQQLVLRITGLGVIEYAPWLFHPLEENYHRDDNAVTATAICTARYSPERLQRDVRERLSTIPQPTGLSLEAAMRLLVDAVTAVVVAGGTNGTTEAALVSSSLFTSTVALPNLTAGTTTTTTTTTTAAVVSPDNNFHNNLELLDDNSNISSNRSSSTYEPKLAGPVVNLVKLVAQMLFYARASGIPFLLQISNAQVYQLLQWVHWTRSVLHVGTVRAATKGAALARAVLESLERQPQDDAADDDTDESSSSTGTTMTITILVGHDGDLDALATVLDVAWPLGPPYQEPRELYATPPGSAMYFKRTADDDDERSRVELSYLYPVFALDSSANMELQMVPLQLRMVDETFNDNSSLIADRHNSFGWNQSALSLTDLRARVASILQRYPGAAECFDASAIFSSPPPLLAKQQTSEACRWTLGALSGTLLILTLMWLYRRCYNRQWRVDNTKPSSNSRTQVYDIVARQGELA